MIIPIIINVLGTISKDLATYVFFYFFIRFIPSDVTLLLKCRGVQEVKENEKNENGED